MRVVLEIMLFLFVIGIFEAMLYLFFAFCIWDINWLPDASDWTRFFYAMLSVMVLPSAGGVAVEIRDSLF